jgi:hypothetical protein
LIIDAGNMALPERAATVTFSLLKNMGYSAVGIGRSEVGPALSRYMDAAKAAGVTVVQVDAKDNADVVPYVIKDFGGVRVGVVSFGYVPDANAGFELSKRRYSAYKEAREKSDILVLMNAGNVVDDDLLQRLASRWGGPDVVIGGTYTSNIYGSAKVVGKTYILPGTPQAKHVGLLNIVIEPGKDPQIKYSQGTLEEAVVEEPAARKALDAYVADEKARVNAMNNAVNQMMSQGSPQSKSSGTPATPVTPNAQVQPQPAPASTGPLMSGVYYDSKSCVSCHKAEYDSWQTTKHAAAVTTLVNKGRDIPSCLECHSERYRQTNAYLPTSGTSKQGVECASCHSRVLPHGADGISKDFEGARIDLDTCRVCHTKDQSPDFESKSKSYWERASHKAAKST